MSDKKYIPNLDECFDKSPQSKLGRILIVKYLNDKGFRLEDLADLPPAEAKELMKEACMFASLKLAEIDAKAHFRIQK
jgi:hypothetical protein